jgi:oxygen-independent coproporphyrinogen-3 oxidase
MRFSLYVHVPFCTRTCPYCNFYQVAYRPAREEPFVEAVLREATLARREFAPPEAVADTLYWGGGTPSLLSPEAIARLAAGLAQVFALEPGLEFTVEANPGEAPPATLAVLRAAGANRLSLGCQSFQPERLAFLGRMHTPEQNRRALADARAAGFENVSLDLIFNLPPEFQREQFRADLEEVLALEPEHVSLYGLTIEPRTAFARRAERGQLALLGAEEYAEEYLEAARALEAAGYAHYETSNFALPGRESAHNSRYWTGGNYLGLGPGAHSLWEGRRWANAAFLETYLSALERGHVERELDERPDTSSRYAETLYLGLRSSRGLAVGELRGDSARLSRFTADLLESGLARESRERLVLSDSGHLVLDEIVTRLLALEPSDTSPPRFASLVPGLPRA